MLVGTTFKTLAPDSRLPAFCSPIIKPLIWFRYVSFHLFPSFCDNTALLSDALPRQCDATRSLAEPSLRFAVLREALPLRCFALPCLAFITLCPAALCLYCAVLRRAAPSRSTNLLECESALSRRPPLPHPEQRAVSQPLFNECIQLLIQTDYLNFARSTGRKRL